MKIKDIKYLDQLKASVMSTLQKVQSPQTLDEIQRLLVKKDIHLTPEEIKSIFDKIEIEGYDIKHISTPKGMKHILVREGGLDSDSYYRSQGEIRTPLIMTSDWHQGSTTYSEIGKNELIKDVIKYKVKDILIDGDLFQGLGVYRTEMADLLVTSADAQIEMAEATLSKFPKDVQFHTVIGNHEEKLKSTYMKGFDMLMNLSRRLKNLSYYGHVAKFTLNKDFTLVMMHGSGGGAYSVSYPAQKVWRGLREHPTILQLGHLHQLDILPMPPNKFIVQSGTLQRENSYLIQKGIFAQVGWVVLLEITKTHAVFVVHRPEVF